MQVTCPCCKNSFHVASYAIRKRLSVEERFWDKVDKSDPSGCWLWRGHASGGGYAQFTVGQQSFPAHRFIWELLNGPIPEGKLVRHKCDVRNCVRIDHLELGTQFDNMMDMVQRKRNRPIRGEDNRFSKLTTEQVIEIKSYYLKGKITQTELGKRYGVHRRTIGMIFLGKRWKHVTSPTPTPTPLEAQ